jgi:excinuclease ABC subunit C
VPPEVIAGMPQSPGLYLMRNERGDLLYVGKATRLKDRIASYFNGGVNLNAKTAELISHVWAIEIVHARSALDAAFTEARLIRELKPPYNRMLKSVAPAFFLKIDLMDPYPRLQLAQKLTNRSGILQLGPFIGRRNLDHSIRALSRILGLRVCNGQLTPHEDFSPCIYGQMGHCTAPCNLSVSEEAYAERVRRALSFLRGRNGPLLGELAQSRDRAATSMRFEEARRCHRDLEALATLAERTTRLSRVVTENNLLIVVPSAPQCHARAYVVLSGRLAFIRYLDSAAAATEVAAFVADNYERYRMRQVRREELEAMTIVARWLRERAPDDGRLIHLNGPAVDPATLLQEG